MARDDRQHRPLKAMIAGLTGSGKTTTAQLVARRAGVEYVSGSALRAAYLGVAPIDSGDDRRAFWQVSSAARAADAARLSGPNSELELDQAMLDMFRATSGGVFDVWFMPWLAEGVDSLRVWLEVDDESRRRRLSRGHGSGSLVSELWDQALQKDERSRAYGLRQYGFDLMHDRQPFDAILRPSLATPPEDVASAVVWCWEQWCGKDRVASAAVRAMAARVPAFAAGSE